ncbi:MAG: VCBS repeat-containing protein [Thermoplasmata archaeon]|nr:MAG: VCBS repeat-containing protein [Thermoplasmata archaeon]
MNKKITVMVITILLMMVPSLCFTPLFNHNPVEQYIPNAVDPELHLENSESPSSITSKTRSGGVNFTNVTDEVGLSGVRGDSYAWGDYNNDGYQDLLVKGSRLFENNGPPHWDFKEVTAQVGLEGSGYAVWGDYNNDGYLDFYAVGHPYEYWDCLWRNSGPPDYSFINVTEDAGNLDDGMPGLAAGWADYDRDGFIDLYIVNWRDADDIRYPDVLYHNNGDGTFIDVTVDAGVYEGDNPFAGMGVNWGDYNNDGWPDIYVSNYLVTPNYLYENNQDGTFSEVAHEKNAAGLAPAGGYYGHTAGSSWADYDHDGDLDMWVSNLAHTTDPRGFYTDYSQMLRNDGPDQGYAFTDVRDDTGIEKKPYMSEDELHFGIAWGDYDNDGDYDMFIPQIKNYVDYAFSFFFENNGDGTFTDVSDDVGVKVWDSDGACWVDYNNDGYIDLITEGKYHYENGKYEVRLFKNNGEAQNNWLDVQLVANESNFASIGARIKVSANGITQMKELEGGTAGHSYQHSLAQHFGFGDYSGDVDIEIWWPSGEERILNDVPTNQRIIVSACEYDPVLFEVTSSDREPYEEDIVTVYATIQNAGRYDIESLFVKFYDGDVNTVPIGTQELNDLSPLEKRFVQIEWDTTKKQGSHKITVQIEDIDLRDDNTVNNFGTIDIKVLKRIPDLMVSSIEFSDSSPFEGDTITITAHIQNLGNREANSATITFFDGDIYTFPIGIKYIIDVPAESDKITHIEWDTTDKKGSHIITILIDDVVPEEEETENNMESKNIEVREYEEPPHQPPKDPNNAPFITEFTCEPSNILVGGSCTLTVYAEDLDGDFLTYDYQATDGIISGYGNVVLWYAPDEKGTYEITVVVKDTKDAEDTESVSVEVKINSPPHIKTFLGSSDVVSNNGIDAVLFTAEIEDENGLQDIDNVRIDLSEIGGSPRQKMYDDGSHKDEEPEDGIYSFEAVIPQSVEPGEKTIRITVKDESGREITQDVIITVISEEKDESERTSEVPIFFTFIIFLAVILTIIATLAFIFQRKKRK